MKQITNIGIIGCGYWGPNLLRNFARLPNTSVVAVAENRKDRQDYVREHYPQIHIFENAEDLIEASGIDAVVIATQPNNHFQLSQLALTHNKHVLVEKPMTKSVAEAQALVELARRHNCQLMVGHTFEYNAAVRELKRLIDGGAIGQTYYVYSQRLNFGIVRQDVNALWNLAPHDVSILLYLFGMMPEAVSARGYDFIQQGIEDVIFMTLHFPGKIVAHIQVSWLDPNKVRRMTVVGSEKMIVYDDVADAKIQIFDKGIKLQNRAESGEAFDDFAKYQLIKTAGDVRLPKIDFNEPLKAECQDFIDAILDNKPPLTHGENGLRVVRVLEVAAQSMQQAGVLLPIPELSEVINRENMVSSSGGCL